MNTESKILKVMSQQIKLALRVSINSKLSAVTKEAYYLRSSIISKFDLDFLDTVLSDWESIDRSEFNSMLKKFIDDDLDEIRKETLAQVPKRQEIINCAFDLYKSKQYLAMIPLVLSQADGIMNEITYGESGLYKVASTKLAYIDSEFYFNFFSNYEQLHVESRNDYELFKKGISDMTKFNRHSILHGESTQFGNELNALKAILLLTFIAEIYDANFGAEL